VREFFAKEWGSMKKLPLKKRMVRSLAGRERRFPQYPTAEVEREFRVTWPQQIEVDLTKAAMARLDRIFRRRNIKARIVMMIHDSIWVEAPHQEAEQVKHLMRRNDDHCGKAPNTVESGLLLTCYDVDSTVVISP
jgi:DNA polymerase I-like protein with 3'-5' exonuclease and polymerase domains